MREILHVTPWFPPDKGGIANYVFNLRNQLTDKGYKISIVTVKRSANALHDGEKFDVSYISCLHLPSWPYPTLRSVGIPLDVGYKLNSILKKGDFDIVHCHGIHYPITWLTVYLARRHGYRCVLSLHGTFALNPNVMSGETMAEKWLYKHLFSRVMSRADALICPAQSITNLAQKYRRQTATTRIYTIEYGLDTARFIKKLGNKKEYRRKYGIDERAITMIFSGRFEKVKGILEFSRAAKKIVDDSHGKIEVIIVGAGSLRTEVHGIVGGSHGIHIFDWQQEERLTELYIASDIFVIPSRFEGVPLTLFEAMNSGLHIVYSLVGGMPDILEQYPLKTSLKEVSDTEIYRVLLAVISMNLGFASEALTYAQRFDWKYIADRIAEVYESIAK